MIVIWPESEVASLAMSFEGQRLDPERYGIVPRTLSFLVHEERILLLRTAPNRGAWGGLLNGIGGHIERGEDPLSAALRELEEEAGIIPDSLILSGVVMIDTNRSTGIGLYVFVGEANAVRPSAGPEGAAEWIPLESLEREDLVEDLPQLVPKAMEAFRSGIPFSARYSYDTQGNLVINFAAPTGRNDED